MTQTDATALKPNDKIGFQKASGQEVVPATVIQNGPRLAPDGHAIPGMDDLLMVMIDGSTVTASWEPINYPAGIPQLQPAVDIGKSPKW